MLWFRTPQKVYFKKGCLPVAMRELKQVLGKQKAFVVTDRYLFQSGTIHCITDQLHELGIAYQIFSDVEPDPTLACAKRGAEEMRTFAPDVIIALGGGSAMDAAKIMWVMYEHPEADFMDMAMRFLDIRKRVYTFPTMGEKAYFIAVPTSSGTGSEVTPFAVITDEKTGVKYPLADYALLPNMAIVDTDLMMTQPKGLTAASGIDALVHSLEAYASVMATDFTDGLALRAIQNIFTYLPACYDNGLNEPVAREKMANASTMAGMAFANAFLGVCHSMAHKLGAFHHLPHGVANAVLLTDVMRYNADPRPQKMGTFSQYAYPHTLERYAEVARFLGLSGNSNEELLEQLIAKIEALKERVGIKKTIRDYGVKEEDFLATLDEMVVHRSKPTVSADVGNQGNVSEGILRRISRKVRNMRVLSEQPNKKSYQDGNLRLKVFGASFQKSDILNEALNQARVEETGLQIPKLLEVKQIDGQWTIVTEFIEGETLESLMAAHPEKMSEYLEQFVALQSEILSKRAPLLNRLKDKMNRKIRESGLDATTRYELHMRLNGMREHEKICHGDFNPSNVIVTPDGDWYVIDWSHVTQGNASADAARTYLLFCLNGKEDVAEQYLQIFCEKNDIAKQYVRSWMPIVAASQLGKGKEDEREFLLRWANVVQYE